MRTRIFSRRDLIWAVPAAALAASGAQGAARAKMTEAEAGYQDRPKDGLSCAACSLFRAPDGCVVVAGAISPHGWCRFFDLPD